MLKGIPVSSGSISNQQFTGLKVLHMKKRFSFILTAVFAIGGFTANAIEGIKDINCDSLPSLEVLAENNDAHAEYLLFELYSNGKCGSKNKEKAGEFLGKAIKQGFGPALGMASMILFSKGRFVQAEKAARAAVEKDDVNGEWVLADLYLQGYEGVPKNYPEGIRWANVAADRGNAFSLFLLGRVYSQGMGVPKDLVLADKFYLLSIRADGGDATIKKLQAEVEAQMTDQEIRKAINLADSWKPLSVN